VATIGAEFATVFTNAMMPSLVPADRLGRLSGIGWAMGYVGGLVSLALMLALLVANPETGLTLAQMPPLFGLDPATGAGDRASGPLSALWYVVFVLPLFLFTPDMPRRQSLDRAIKNGVQQLAGNIRALGANRNALLYLLAHMVYVDGLVALFAFGGIYATGTFGWHAVEIGLFGISLLVTGIAGAWIGGILDDRVGPKTVIMGALIALCIASIGILSITADSILFFISTAPALAGDGLFASVPERLYLALGVVIGAVAGPLQSASRTLLVRVSPPDSITQYFGLYALAGKLTSFIGPTLVGAVTLWTASPRAGISVLLGFFVLGMLLLLPVHAATAPSRV